MKTAPWPDPPELGPEAVHLWWARVDPDEPPAPGSGRAAAPDSAPAAGVSPAERERAARFHFERDRRRYLARRSFLRGLLGRYLAAAPLALAFDEGPHGKPGLAGRTDLEFNLSHSRGWVLVAVARARPVGVDVEAHQLRTELDAMAAQVFTARERTALAAIERDARLAAFFRGWTRKEAALKATGEGFAREPRTLEVGLAPRPAGEVWSAAGEPVLRGYGLADLAAPEGFSAALCVARDGWRPAVVAAWEDPVLVGPAGPARV